MIAYPKRIRLSRAKGWRLPEGTINCARPGPWGNPFKVGRNGDGEACVRLHRLLLLDGHFASAWNPSTSEQRQHLDHVLGHLTELRGHDVACWCCSYCWCHADTLLVLANGAPPLAAEERADLDHFAHYGEAGHIIHGWRARPNIVRLVRFLLVAPVAQPGGGEALTITARGRAALELVNR